MNRDELLTHHSGAGKQICDGSCESWKNIPPASYALLLGYYLGDGCISPVGRIGTFAMRIVCCDAYPLIMDECEATIRAVNPRRPVCRTQSIGCTMLSSQWKHWPCLFPQHGPGRKHERELFFSSWQFTIINTCPELVLRGLINSDGCRILNRVKNGRFAYSRYHFTNMSSDIMELCVWLCDQLGVRWTRCSATQLAISRRADVAILDTFIGEKR